MCSCKRGLKLLAAKLMRADESLLRRHYADLAAKGFFPELVRYMASGPVLPMVWQGLNAVKQGRAMLGATNPKVPVEKRENSSVADPDPSIIMQK